MSFIVRWLHRLWAFVVGDAVITLIATTAVAPFAIYHFHRLSHYGVVANLIALPLVSLLMMPFALLSLGDALRPRSGAVAGHGDRH